MQTPDARAARVVAARLVHGTHDVYLDPWGNLCVDDVPQETNVDVAVATALLLDCIGSDDVEANITERMAAKRCQFAPVLKRVLAKIDGHLLDLVGQVLRERAA